MKKKKIKRKKKKNVRQMKIKVLAFLDMLKQAHLGGILEECVLTIRKGKAKIEAVDITNSLIIICRKSIMLKGVTVDLGLGNIDILIKFLSTIDDSKLLFKYSDTGFELSKPSGRRKFNYLLTQPDLIATQLQEDRKEEGDDPYKKMQDMMEYKVELTSSLIKDFLSYINLLKTKDVTLKFDGDEKLIFACGGTNDHQFELSLSSEVEGDESDPLNIKINGEHLAKIFATINFDEDSPPTLSFADELIMIENNNAAWALVPLTDLEETDEDDIPF